MATYKFSPIPPNTGVITWNFHHTHYIQYNNYKPIPGFLTLDLLGDGNTDSGLIYIGQEVYIMNNSSSDIILKSNNTNLPSDLTLVNTTGCALFKFGPSSDASMWYYIGGNLI